MTLLSAERSAQKDNTGGQLLASVSANVLMAGDVIKTNSAQIFAYHNVT